MNTYAEVKSFSLWLYQAGNRSRGVHLGIFWVGMYRPGLQIGTPF